MTHWSGSGKSCTQLLLPHTDIPPHPTGLQASMSPQGPDQTSQHGPTHPTGRGSQPRARWDPARDQATLSTRSPGPAPRLTQKRPATQLGARSPHHKHPRSHIPRTLGSTLDTPKQQTQLSSPLGAARPLQSQRPLSSMCKSNRETRVQPTIGQWTQRDLCNPSRY